jgi:ATP-dependent helicase/nuclease subunit A
VSAGGIGAERAADAAAREAAQRVFDRPLVIEAGAGTGKTATLVARILAWCLGPGWERAAAERADAPARGARSERAEEERTAAAVLDGVVAITFTEAAAAEMATRVATALAELQRGDAPLGFGVSSEVDDGERNARATALLVALDHLSVSTIHAFCRRILAAAPLEAGLHPAFTVDADGSALAAVVDEVVERQQRDAFARAPDVHLLALAEAGCDLPSLAETVSALAARAVPAAALETDPFDSETVRALRDGLVAAAAAFAAAGGERVGAAPGTRTPGRVLAALADTVAACDELDVSSLQALDGFCERMRTAWDDTGLLERLRLWSRDRFGERERGALGDAADAVVAGAAALARRIGALCELRPVFFDHARRVVAPLLAAAHRELRMRGVESFDDLLRDARDLLVGHPEVAARVRGGIRQLLVDEFQDTDRLQCEILRALALGGGGQAPGLFLVGDPKQSIFGWREADLGAYESFVAEVLAAGGEKHTLCVSYRSVPAILDEVARCVAPVMEAEPGVQPAFQRLLPSPDNEGRSGFAQGRWAAVEMWVPWGGDDARGGGGTRSADATEIEAAALAADLHELHEHGGVAWRDIGVLLRTSGDLDEVLQALREAGVPYLVERDRSYYRRREIIDAAALVRTILDPADHLALVTWLRSAAVGVPDAAWIPLWANGLPGTLTALAGSDPVRLEAVRGIIEAAHAALPTDVPGLDRIAGWERNLVAAVWHLAMLREAFARESAAAFVEQIRRRTLFEASEAARTLGAFRAANLDRFFRELLAAIEGGGGDAHAVLRALREATATRREAEEARPRGAVEDAVRVMTVHKAKGLDFNHVYLMQTHKTTDRRERTECEAREVDGRFDVVLFGAPSPGWDAVAEHRRRIADAERVRTLYVALTRARERLVVSGNWYGRRETGSHLELLYRREGAGPDHEQLEALRETARAGPESFVDDRHARWVFPALRARESPPHDSQQVELPAAAEVAAQAARLASLRRDAATRMARPFSAPASQEAHQELRDALAEANEEEASAAARSTRRIRRDAATAAGSAVHRALELIDLGGDIAAELARQRGLLPSHLAGLVGPEAQRAALERAQEMLDRLADSPLARRLAEIAPHVVARELPVYLPPGEGEDAPAGFVSGRIDLVYRDPASDEFVILDYKTDAVKTEDEISEHVKRWASQGAVYSHALRDALGLDAPPRFELWFLAAGRVV